MCHKNQYVSLKHAGMDLNRKLNIHRVGIFLFHNVIRRNRYIALSCKSEDSIEEEDSQRKQLFIKTYFR